jgi:hypothetical protein
MPNIREARFGKSQIFKDGLRMFIYPIFTTLDLIRTALSKAMRKSKADREFKAETI